MKVFVIGSAVVDILAAPIAEEKNWKEKQRIEQIRILPGGDAVNQSIRLANLGGETYLCAAIGTDPNGTLLQALLEKRGVHTDYLARKDHSTGAAMVLVRENGERNTFSVKGAHSLLQKNDLPAPEMLAAEGFSAVSLASLFSMPLLEADGLEAYLRELQALGIRVWADLANDKQGLGLAGIRNFLPYIDYFLPSLYDAAAMTGKETPEEAAEVFAACGSRNVLIKCGGNGCYYRTSEGSGHVPALPVTPVDTTGAGDCMAALFLERIVAGQSVKDALAAACRGASVSTLFAGASAEQLSWEKIERIAAEYGEA